MTAFWRVLSTDPRSLTNRSPHTRAGRTRGTSRDSSWGTSGDGVLATSVKTGSLSPEIKRRIWSSLVNGSSVSRRVMSPTPRAPVSSARIITLTSLAWAGSIIPPLPTLTSTRAADRPSSALAGSGWRAPPMTRAKVPKTTARDRKRPPHRSRVDALSTPTCHCPRSWHASESRL